MSVNAYVNMRLGIEVDEDDFWTVVGKVWSCKNEHQFPGGSQTNFCPKCGTKVSYKDRVEPTRGLKNVALKLGVEPDELYQSLIDEDVIVSSEEELSYEEFKDSNKIFSVVLGTPTSMHALEEAKTVLRKKADRYGIPSERPIQLYCQLYWS